MLKIKATLLSLFFIGFFSSSYSKTVYVNLDAPAGGDGASWATALNNLASALSLASSGDQVWIAEGTYRGQYSANTGVSIYGGFKGTESSVTERINELYPTVLSGDIDGNDNPDILNIGPGDPTRADNVQYTILTAGGDATNAFVLDGVTIRDHYSARFAAFRIKGSGDIALVNCQFIANYNNYTSSPGGACVIDDNLLTTGNITLKGCYFYANTSNQTIIDIEKAASCTVQNCYFDSDKTTGSQGKIIYSISSLFLYNTNFIHNSSGNGILNVLGGSLEIAACGFFGSAISSSSYGLISINNSPLKLYNSVFSGSGYKTLTTRNNNSATPSEIYHCTFYGEPVSGSTGVLLRISGTSTINFDFNIIWGIAATDQTFYPATGAFVSNHYNIIQYNTGGYATAYAVDPLFLNPDGVDNTPGTIDDNFQLSASSPALDIDSTNPNVLPPDSKDLDNDGNVTELIPAYGLLNRDQGTFPDAGALERGGPDLDYFFQSTGEELLNGQAYTIDFGTVELGSDENSTMVSIEMKNVGTQDLTATKTPDPAGFTSFFSGNTSPLSSGSGLTDLYWMQTAVAGEREGYVKVTTNDADENEFIIHLKGTVCTAAPYLFNIETDSLSYTEGQYLNSLTDKLKLCIYNDSLLDSAFVTIKNYVPGEDSLFFNDTSSINHNFNASSGRYEFRGSATLPDYTYLLRTVGYTDTDTIHPNSTQRVIEFSAYANGVKSNLLTRNMNFFTNRDIYSFFPDTVGVADTLTVYHDSFNASVNQITIGGAVLSSSDIIYLNDTTTRLVVPAAPMSGDTVKISLPGDILTGNDFTLSTPVINLLKPNPSLGQDTVALIGKYLGGITSVKFNGAAVTVIKTSSDHDTLLVFLPANATSDTFKVTNALGASLSPLLTVVTDSITTSDLSADSLCAGSSVTVTFDAKGIYSSSNTFYVELSQPDGVFGPLRDTVGTVNAQNGIHNLSITIPADASPSDNYHVRTIASDRHIQGDSNATAFKVRRHPGSFTLNGPALLCQSDSASVNVVGTGNVEDFIWNITGAYLNPVDSAGPGSDTIPLYFNTPGTVTVKASAVNWCGTTSITPVDIVVSPSITVDAGTDLSACGNSPIAVKPSVSNASKLKWTTSGTGTFANDTLASTSYTPSSGDISAGSVYLKLEAGDPSGGCPAVSDTILVTTYPQPVVTNSESIINACAGALSPGLALTSDIPATFSWTTTASAGISGFTASGTGDIPSEMYVNSKTTTGVAEYSVVPSANGCTGAIKKVSVLVSPQPDLTNATLTNTICEGDTTPVFIPQSDVSGASFDWTSAADTGITGNTTSGTGNIPKQTYANADSVPRNVTYTITPQYSGCAGIAKDYVVTVNPGPEVTNSALSETICEGDMSSGLSITADMAGATFNWTATATNSITGYTTSGTGNIPAESFDNPSVTAGTVTYTITPLSSSGCAGSNTDYTVTVNPKPEITNALLNDSVCEEVNAGGLAITPDVSGATYTWTAVADAGVSGYTVSGSGDIPQEIYSNDNSADGNVTYTIIPQALGCTGAAADYVVTVKPIPVVTNPDLADSICSGSLSPGLTLTADVAGSVFSWTSAATSGVSGNTGSGTGNIIQEILTDNQLTADSVIYAITPSAAGCSGTTVNYKVTVKPLPTLTNADLQDTICIGVRSNGLVLESGIPATTFSWLSYTSGGITGNIPAGSGNIPGETYSNSSGALGTVTYEITPTFDGCNGPKKDYVVFVQVHAIQADAGNDFNICVAEPVTLNANDPGAGNGIWKILPGTFAGISIDNTSLYNSSVQGLTTAGDVLYASWTVSNECSSSSDTVVVTGTGVVSASVALQLDTSSLCDGGTPVFTATPRNGGSSPTYAFYDGPTIVQGPGADNTYDVFQSASRSIYVKMTSNSGCLGANPATVTSGVQNFTVYKTPVITNTTLTEGNCEGFPSKGVNITTDVPGSNTSWTSVADAGIAGNTISGFGDIPSETFSNTGSVSGKVTYAIVSESNGCISDTVNYIINVDPKAEAANAGKDFSGCVSEPIRMIANDPSPGVGTWTILAGTTSGVSIDNPNQYNSPVSGMVSGGEVLNARWTITDGNCPTTYDDITITGAPIDTPRVDLIADDTVFCVSGTPTFTAVPVNGGTSPLFTFYDANGTILQPQSASTTYTGSFSGNGGVYAEMTSNSVCLGGNPATVQSEIRTITITEAPQITNTTLSETICEGDTSGGLTLISDLPGTTYSWTSVATAGVVGNTNMGTGNIPKELFANSTLSTGKVTYTITPSADGCTGSAKDFTVNINKSPSAAISDVASTILLGQSEDLRIDLTGDSPWSLIWTDGVSTFTETDITASPYYITVSPRSYTEYRLISVQSNATGCFSTNVSGMTAVTVNKLTPSVVFPDQNAVYGDSTVQMKAGTNSDGTKSYSLINPPGLTTINPTTGLVSFDRADTLQVQLIVSETSEYKADTAYAKVYIDKAESFIQLNQPGCVVGDVFKIKAVTNYDLPLVYSNLGSDSIASVSPDGTVTARSEGEITVFIEATGSDLYKPFNKTITIKVFKKTVPPVAVSDTLRVYVDTKGTINILENDYGVTGTIVPALTDIDSSAAGIQNQAFNPSVGTFLIDSAGTLTFTPFEGFIGESRIGYTVVDDDGITSAMAYVLVIVTTPITQTPLKANEIMTPNNDLKNDALVIGYADETKDNTLIIFNEVGNQVYSKSNYRNDWKGVDGYGNDLENGTYFFVFTEYNSGGTKGRELKSYFQIIR